MDASERNRAITFDDFVEIAALARCRGLKGRAAEAFEAVMQGHCADPQCQAVAHAVLVELATRGTTGTRRRAATLLIGSAQTDGCLIPDLLLLIAPDEADTRRVIWRASSTPTVLVRLFAVLPAADRLRAADILLHATTHEALWALASDDLRQGWAPGAALTLSLLAHAVRAGYAEHANRWAAWSGTAVSAMRLRAPLGRQVPISQVAISWIMRLGTASERAAALRHLEHAAIARAALEQAAR